MYSSAAENDGFTAGVSSNDGKKDFQIKRLRRQESLFTARSEGERRKPSLGEYGNPDYAVAATREGEDRSNGDEGSGHIYPRTHLRFTIYPLQNDYRFSEPDFTRIHTQAFRK